MVKTVEKFILSYPICKKKKKKLKKGKCILTFLNRNIKRRSNLNNYIIKSSYKLKLKLNFIFPKCIRKNKGTTIVMIVMP